MEVAEQDWREWRHEEGGILWRIAVPDDIPALNGLIDTTELKLKAKQRRPNFFDSPILICLVAELRDGKIVDAVYIELEAQVKKVGIDSQSFRSSLTLMRAIESFLRSRKIRTVRITVLRRWRWIMAPFLKRMGFVRSSDEFHFWTRTLR